MKKQLIIFTLIMVALIIAGGISTKEKKYPANYNFVLSGSLDSNFRASPDSVVMYVVKSQRSQDSIAAAEARVQSKIDKQYFYDGSGKNMFDSTAVINGYYINNTTGALVSHSTSSITAYIPCIPNTYYNMSGNLNGMIAITKRYYDADSTYLSFHNSAAATIRSWKTPANCYYFQMTIRISYPSPKYSNVQIEQGIEQTDYDNYFSAKNLRDSLIIKNLYAPVLNTMSGDSNAITSKVWVENRYKKNEVAVIKYADTLYIRTKFDNSRDIVHRLSAMGSLSDTSNNPVNFLYTYLIPNTNVNSLGALLSSAILIHYPNDDACPVNYNGSYMGANHGCSDVRLIKKTSHGLTTSKIGIEWTDWSTRKWYIVRIVDENTFWLLSTNIGTGDIWDFDTTIDGNLWNGADSLIVKTGATVTAGSMKPIIKNQIKVLAGNIDITEDGLYYCEKAIIKEQYDIVNPKAQLDSIKAHAGSVIEPNIGTSNMRMNYTYTFDKYGGILVDLTTNNPNYEIDITNIGVVQSIKLTQGSYDSIFVQVPQTLIYGSDIYYRPKSFKTNPSVAVNFTSTYWDNANIPPNRAIMYLSDNDRFNCDVVYSIGYLPVADGLSSARKTNVATSIQINTTGKIYPYGVGTSYGNIAKTKLFEFSAYRSYKPFGYYSTGPQSVNFVEKGGAVYVIIDYLQSVSFDEITLPVEYNGMSVTTHEKSTNITVHSTIVNSNKIYISNTGTTEYAILILR